MVQLNIKIASYQEDISAIANKKSILKAQLRRAQRGYGPMVSGLGLRRMKRRLASDIDELKTLELNLQTRLEWLKEEKRQLER